MLAKLLVFMTLVLNVSCQKSSSQRSQDYPQKNKSVEQNQDVQFPPPLPKEPVIDNAEDCQKRGAVWREGQCIHGIKQVYVSNGAIVAQRSSNVIVSWGKTQAMANYDRVRAQLYQNNATIKKVVFAGSVGVSVLLENGHLISWGSIVSSNFDAFSFMENVHSVESNLNSVTALVDEDSDGTCDDGCRLINIGGEQPASVIRDARKIVTTARSNLTMVLHQDKTISHFPEKDSRVSAVNWQALDESKNNNFIDGFISYNKSLIGLKEDGTAILWGNTRAGIDQVGREISDVRLVDGFFDGEYATYAIKKDASIVAWGDEAYFSTDDSSYTSMTAQSTQLKDIKKIVSAYESTLVLRDDGRLIFWGYNEYGKDILDRVGGNKVKDIWTLGGYNFVALLEDNALIVSDGDWEGVATDNPIPNVVSLSVNESHIIYTKLDGSKGYIGSDKAKLGFAELESYRVPVKTIFNAGRFGGASFVLTEDLVLFPVGASRYGTDLTAVDLDNANRIFWRSSGDHAFAIKLDQLSVYSLHSDNRLLPQIEASSIREIVSTNSGGVIILKDGTAYDIDFNNWESTRFENIVTAHAGNNSHLLLQGGNGQESCDVGCMVIPRGRFTDVVELIMNDPQAENPVLNGIEKVIYDYGYVYLFGVDTSIQLLKESDPSYQAYFPESPDRPEIISYTLNQSSLAAIKADKTVIVFGKFSQDLSPTCESLSNCFLPTKPLENVVDLIASGQGFTALIAPVDKDDCKSGCSVSSWGQFSSLSDQSNLMGDAGTVSDFTEIFTSGGSFLGRRLDNSWVSWGSVRMGADPSCNDPANDLNNNCVSYSDNGQLSVDMQVHRYPDYDSSTGFIGVLGDTIDFWGTNGSMGIDDLTLPNLINVHVQHGQGIALASSEGNCSKGCNYALLGDAVLNQNGTTVQGKVIGIRKFHQYWELDLANGDKAYVNLPQALPQLISTDKALLQPSR